jgi:hypothetical protein
LVWTSQKKFDLPIHKAMAKIVDALSRRSKTYKLTYIAMKTIDPAIARRHQFINLSSTDSFAVHKKQQKIIIDIVCLHGSNSPHDQFNF